MGALLDLEPVFGSKSSDTCVYLMIILPACILKIFWHFYHKEFIFLVDKQTPRRIYLKRWKLARMYVFCSLKCCHSIISLIFLCKSFVPSQKLEQWKICQKNIKHVLSNGAIRFFITGFWGMAVHCSAQKVGIHHWTVMLGVMR